MNRLAFQSNAEPTLGIELELCLVDAQSMELSSSIGDIMQRVPEQFAGCIKPELMQCDVEVISGVCRTVDEAQADLSEKLRCVESITDDLGLRLWWGASHPFSLWQRQQITPDERYHSLVELLQDMARQLVTCGLHVHVGVESGDKAVMICDRIIKHLPTLLAISCSSPYWNNRATGMQSRRAKLMENLPTAGLPPLMRNWSEYVWVVNHLIDTGFITTIREIWWDVRPHHNFGTVEMRVCDMPGDLDSCLALAALVQCLVKALSDEIDEGTYQHDCHPMIVRQNKWRACRFGRQARLVDSFSYETLPVVKVVEHLVELLTPVAEELDCTAHLKRNIELAAGPDWAERQTALMTVTGDPVEVVRRMSAESRISK